MTREFISRCELPSSLMVDIVKFKSLKMLKLEYVPLHDELIKRLTMSCPLLEKMILHDCQEVQIRFGDEVLEVIDIDAPNLWHLLLVDLIEVGDAIYESGLMQKTNKLSYYGYPSPTSKGLVDLSSDFPFLEELYLKLYDPRSLKLSSHSVRTFELCADLELHAIDLSAPNMLLFIFTYTCFDSGVKKDSTPSKARMEYEGFVERYRFQYLWQFLDKNIGFKELKLRIDEMLGNSWGIQSSPYELEHVEIYIEELSVYEAVVYAVLWCCRPHSLTLEANFDCTNNIEEWSHIVKFTHEKLLLQEDEGKTNIGILITSSSNVKKHFSDLNSFLTASPRDLQGERITFIKEEGMLFLLSFSTNFTI
ncbi:F-box domain, Leucine-rich repeat domain, L domain-like protein [Artemisia annua]|uniref:F-box domain, Leucine-rich repeat domain, L domain-like protein n=1 Tax=Artemisia annua TaxID=35608 RepID=A0A2U1NF38_ARTAN|nr:F-box domain, Leucine-rich repeat domain, L domain-like protein [Artemisia annua]